jgi:copper homeostasis protein
LLLELCAYNIQSCHIAVSAGAGRIELCSSPADGGITPGYGIIKYAIEHISIPVFPMIRPRGGNFLYDSEELEIMKKDILLCKEIGCKGIAIGAHKADKQLDADNMKRFVEWAYPMEVTCHKVFDRVPDPFEALHILIDAGCSRLLTSGLQNSAVDGAELIVPLIAAAAGRITIMPGGGVRSSNISKLATATNAREFHSSGILSMSTSQIADKTEVTNIIKALKEL